MLADPAAELFETLRPRLYGIASRRLGSGADAEEVVQETFLRWRQAAHGLRSHEAWLVSVTTRLSIDRLRRAATERAAYEGQWLPEPVPFAPPERGAELADDLSLAFLVLLERLAPDERAAFLLREVFDAGYEEIARTLGKGAAACRQIVHRAKRRVQSDRRRFTATSHAEEGMAVRFAEALRNEDREELLALLDDAALLRLPPSRRPPPL